MIKIKFKKLTTVDYGDATPGELGEKTFYHNDIVDVKTVENTSSNYANIHFLDGNIAFDVPVNTFEKL